MLSRHQPLERLRSVIGVEAVACVPDEPVRLEDLRGSAMADEKWREVAGTLLDTVARTGREEAFSLVSYASRRLLQLRCTGELVVVVASPGADLADVLAAMKAVRDELDGALESVGPRAALGQVAARIHEQRAVPRHPHIGPTLRGLGEVDEPRRRENTPS